jgi:hypothetical protein
MKAGRIKRLLAMAAAAITHQENLDPNPDRRLLLFYCGAVGQGGRQPEDFGVVAVGCGSRSTVWHSVPRELISARALSQSFAQHTLIDAAACAASSQLSVNYNSRKAPDAVLCGAAGDFMFMHVVNVHLMLRACQLFDRLNGLFARGATRTVDLDFVFHIVPSPFLLSFTVMPPFAEMHSGQMAAVARRATYSKPTRRSISRLPHKPLNSNPDKICPPESPSLLRHPLREDQIPAA